MTQEKDKTKPPTQTICAGGRIAYDFPIRYAPNRVVRFEDLTSWSSIPEGYFAQLVTIFQNEKFYDHKFRGQEIKYTKKAKSKSAECSPQNVYMSGSLSYNW